MRFVHLFSYIYFHIYACSKVLTLETKFSLLKETEVYFNTSSDHISVGVNTALNFHLTNMVPVAFISKNLHQDVMKL